MTVVLVPVPVVTTPSGDLVRVHVPAAGRLLSTTLPVVTVHVGWVTVPWTGVEGTSATVKVYVAVATIQMPDKSSVASEIVTVFPTSPSAGV